MSNQSRRQQAVRDITGTTLDYNSDFLALFALSGFTTGTFNERFLLWLNSQMGTDYGDPNATSKGGLPGAMHAYAVSLGYNDWNSLDTIEGFLLDAPVLDWDDETEDDTPDANVDLPEDVEEGMFLRSQIATDSSFTSPTETDVEIDATAVSNGELDLGLSSLSDGTYYWRVRVLSDALAAISPWSNTETVTISTGGDTAGEPIGLLLLLTKAA
jgi:hypothetical protein